MKIKLKNKQIKNIGYLYIVQVINQIFPILTIPLLVKNLGVIDYAKLQFALSISGYIYLVADYGFALSGPKELVCASNDNERINSLYYTIQCIRCFLVVISYLFLMIFFKLTNIFETYEIISLLFFGYTIGNVLFPVWFFQGKEDLQVSSTITVISRVIHFFLLLYIIKSGKGINYTIFTYCLVNIMQCVIAHLIIVIKYKLHLSILRINEIKRLMREGWTLFISQSATSLFSSINVILLGAIATPFDVAVFSTGEKIVRAAANFLGPISRVVYPSSCRHFANDVKTGFSYIRRLKKIIIPLFGFGSFLLFVLAPFISILLSNSQHVEVTVIIRILSSLPLLIAINNLAGTQTMINLGKEKALKNITLLTGILNIIFALLFVPVLGAYGMAISSLLAEINMMLCTVLYVFIWEKKNEYI